jgi:hypothetical protein
LAAVTIGVPTAGAQYGGYSTYQAGPGRTGNNGNAAYSGPQLSNLTWFQPTTSPIFNFANPAVIDNTDTNPPTLTVNGVNGGDGGPYQANSFGYTLQNQYINVSKPPAWFGPADPNGYASPNYDPDIRNTSIGYNGTNYGPNYNQRYPAYLMQTCVPALTPQQVNSNAPPNTPYDPTAGATSTFTWVFTGIPQVAGGNPLPSNYAVYVNIPAGPTWNYVANPNTETFPPEFYVFVVRSGKGGSNVYVDVVDTYLSGGGWVRLGAGGAPNNVVFNYDGVNPITVTLYNTVPYNSNGALSMAPPENQYVVYADAAKFVPAPGYTYSTPVATRLTDTNPLSTIVTVASNIVSAAPAGTVGTTSGGALTSGTVITYPYNGTNANNPALGYNWRYSPLEEGPSPILWSDFGNQAGTFQLDSTAATYTGPTQPAATSAIVGTINANPPVAPTGSVLYQPKTALTNQTYNIYAYTPGNDATHKYATGTIFEVTYDNGAGAAIMDQIAINQSQPAGWVQVGVKRYPNTQNVPLTVQIVNLSSNASDVNLLGYADAIRFVGQANQAITSTPVHAYVNLNLNNGTTAMTKVTIICDENGVIHCVDSTGNPDGTTTEYWSYPSTRDSNGYDPNLGTIGGLGPDYGGDPTVPAAQRSPTAEMPQGFNLSSAVVVGQTLYVGTVNGRVYAVNMGGAGNYNSTDSVSGGFRKVGTTTRVWTYPATYPSKQTYQTSGMESIPGSVAYGTPGGVGAIFVPTYSGRIYSLTATGNADLSTNANWAFPKENAPNLGVVAMAPLVQYNSVFFGTQQQTTANGTLGGRFFRIDWQTGAEVWETNFANFTTYSGMYPAYVAPLDFISSPCTATNADLNPTTSTDTTAGLIYAINQNGVLYGIDTVGGGVQWADSADADLGAGAQGGLTFTWQTVYDNNGNQNPYPTVLVPCLSGVFDSFFARTGDVNVDGTKLAWNYYPQGDSTYTSMAVQDMGTTGQNTSPPTGYMFSTDDDGFLYAFSNNLGTFGNGQPGGAGVVPNNPIGQVFNKMRISVLPNQATFQALRQSPTTLTYQQLDALLPPDSTVPVATKNGFEWGQTMYVVVYRFPFLTSNTSGTLVDPPVVNISLNVNGRVVRNVSIQSRQFANAASSPTYNQVNPLSVQDNVSNPPLDGYAVLAFPFQNSGANSLPPGSGSITATISTSALNPNGIQQNVLTNPTIGTAGTTGFPFVVANPLAVIVPPPGQTLSPTTSFLPASLLPASGRNGTPTNLYTYGVTNNPVDPQNLINGTVNTSDAPNGALLGAATIDKLTHGGTGSLVFYVVDRSMMALLRPNPLTEGLDQVRLQRNDLAWQDGTNTVIKALNTSYYSGYQNFEDMPVNYPNDSLDYPDIHRQNVLATTDPAGSPQNPLFGGVTLYPPVDGTSTAGNLVALTPNSDPTKRILRATAFEIDFNVPKYQPANLHGTAPYTHNLVNNSAGIPNPIQGYLGQLQVFVDSTNSGQLNTAINEAYRSMNISTSVDMDERMSVTTPTVDLGSLPAGAGYSSAFLPGSGFSQNSAPGQYVFSPWGGQNNNYASIFQPFGVENDGNTNLLDLRVAKISPFFPTPGALQIQSTDNDMYAYLDGSFDVWSNLDPVFSCGPDQGARVFLQKPRVLDNVPTTLAPNPVRRANQNLGTTGTVMLSGKPVPDCLNQTVVGGALLYDPRLIQPEIGVSVPIGFPVGKYSASVNIFENDNGDGDVAQGTKTPIWDTTTAFGATATPEPYTEHGLQLSFNVIETRLTNTISATAEPMFDFLSPGGASGQYENANVQPAAARDASGTMLVAWASNRPSMTTSIQGPDNGQYLIYMGSLGNKGNFSTSPNGGIGNIGGTSPLNDLDYWFPGIQGSNNNWGQWFNPAVKGYPTSAPATLFGGNGTLLASTARFGNPTFPGNGARDPFNPSNVFTGLYMAFTGEIQRQNADGSVQRESRLMLSSVGSSGGVVNPTAPIVDTNDDPLTLKGKPSVVETGTSTAAALLFYPVTGGGQSTILYNAFNGSAFGQPSALPFGNGFESVGTPSAVGRIMNLGRTTQQNVVELTFSGTLRGRSYSDIYLGRLQTTANGTDLVRDSTGNVASSAFIDLPTISNETLLADTTQSGLYRAQGVDWDRGTSVLLTTPNNTNPNGLLIAGTGIVDTTTGLVSYDTTLGGKVYLDPALGTVRFSNAAPARNLALILTYTPKFLRISGGTTLGGVAGYTAPSTVFDNHFITDATFWFTPNGTPTTAQGQKGLLTTSADGNLLENERMVFTYNRASAGAGLGSRPFVTTMRFGVRLPYRLPTLTSGLPGVSNGNTTLPAIQNIVWADGQAGDDFQMDPTEGTGAGVYFPSSDEGRQVTIFYYGVDASGHLIVDGNGNPIQLSAVATVSLVPEHTEAPLPIETSVNESGLTAFMDPFSYSNASGNGTPRRPSLIYLIWSSTRYGAPDLYMESIAPQWTPIIVQGN